MTAQVASALAAALDQGLVHRDVKPANILVGDTGQRVWITSFGLARAVDDASLTRTGFIAGTPQCMSLEQARGEVVRAGSDLDKVSLDEETCVSIDARVELEPLRSRFRYGPWSVVALLFLGAIGGFLSRTRSAAEDPAGPSQETAEAEPLGAPFSDKSSSFADSIAVAGEPGDDAGDRRCRRRCGARRITRAFGCGLRHGKSGGRFPFGSIVW